MNIKTLVNGAISTNTYILINGGNAVIVDPYETDAVLNALDGLTPVCVLLTHGHFDHIGAVADLQKKGALVYMHKSDYDMLNKSNWVFDIGYFRIESPRFTPDVFVDDGSEFVIEDMNISVIHTPGHTPGGVCYLVNSAHLFSGDTLFFLDAGRTDLEFSQSEKLPQSLQKLFKLDGSVKVYPGHGRTTDIAFERMHNPNA